MLLMLGLWLFNVTLQIGFNVIPIKINIILPLTGDNVKRSTAVGSSGFPAGCEEECLLYRRCRSLQREEWGESERRSCWWLSKSKCSGKSMWKWRHKNNGKIWGVLSKNNRKKGLHVVSAHVSFWSFYPDSCYSVKSVLKHFSTNLWLLFFPTHVLQKIKEVSGLLHSVNCFQDLQILLHVFVHVCL